MVLDTYGEETSQEGNEDALLEDTYAEVQRRFAHVDDPAHGWEHIERVFKLALDIAEQEGANPFIVGMAALMHDLGRASHNDDVTHHADLSVRAASEILDSLDVASETRAAILHAIEAHSFSRGVEPRTLEACVMRDADRLEGLGAIGIVRWAITGTLRRTPHTRVYHPTDPFVEQHEPDDSIYMLDHFYTKLLKLQDTMATATGRMLARRRTDFMYAYLNELRNEIL